MQFRDLKAQYQALKTEIDAGMADVLASGQFILGKQLAQFFAFRYDLFFRHGPLLLADGGTECFFIHDWIPPDVWNGT